MKRWGILLALCGLFCSLWGCGAGETTVWETVGDQLELPASHQSPAYTMQVAAPMDAPLVEALSDGETKVYVHRGGEYELTAQTMTADSLDSLLQTLTGFPQASLQVLQTEEFGMPRYDVAWTASGDSGMESCRAAILDVLLRPYLIGESGADGPEPGNSGSGLRHSGTICRRRLLSILTPQASPANGQDHPETL